MEPRYLILLLLWGRGWCGLVGQKRLGDLGEFDRRRRLVVRIAVRVVYPLQVLRIGREAMHAIRDAQRRVAPDLRAMRDSCHDVLEPASDALPLAFQVLS